jgi:hypothetical protein
MGKIPTIRSKKVRDIFLIALTFTVLLTPTGALAVQRDGNVLFFSFEELKEGLANLTPAAPLPRFSWRRSQPQAKQESPIERNYRWGDGLGIDGYAHPGVRRPLWG